MKNRGFRAVKWLLAAYLFVTVALPLFLLIGNIHISDVSTVLSSAQFLPMLKNSVLTTLISTVISVGLSFLLAFCIHRSGIRFKSIWSILFTIPMLIPSISHGMGLVLLFGDNGILTNLLGINIGLYGYTGIIMGSVMYSFPVSFLMLSDAFQYEDYTTYEAAQVLGYTGGQTFGRILLPQMIRRVLPPVTNEVITLVKDTSLASVIGTVEMFTRAKQIVASPNTPGMLALAAAGLFYYVFNYIVAFAMERAERSLAYYQ